MKSSFILGIVTLLVALSQGIVSAESGWDLFQKALVKERAEGKIEEAIQLYQRVVSEFGSDRVLAAKALIQMGQGFEKLGKPEARSAYERVVNEYADQSEPVRLSRARLRVLVKTSGLEANAGNMTSRLPVGSSVLTARLVWSGREVDVLGSPSPDGRYLSYVDWSSGDLAIRDLSTEKSRRLTGKGSWDSPEMAFFSIFSPSGEQLAYSWLTKSGLYELRVLSTNAPSPASSIRTVFQSQEISFVTPASWTPDGKQVLSRITSKNGANQIALISVAEGSVKVLKTLDWRFPGTMSLSPDGRYVAYDFPPAPDVNERDLFLLASDGSREIELVSHPAQDLYPIWTPDGSKVLFVSDRTGQAALWMAPVSEGKPSGPAELLKSDIGQTYPIGITRGGPYFYGVRTGLRDVHTAAIDVDSGKTTVEPQRLTQSFVGQNHHSVWSPDGDLIAFLSERGRFPGLFGSAVLVIRSTQTGKDRDMPLRLRVSSGGEPQWSPDGKSLLVIGIGQDGRQGLHCVDVESGATHLLMRARTPGYLFKAAWSEDGKRIYFREHIYQERTFRIAVHNLTTGATRDLLIRTDYNSGAQAFALSDDGRWIAFVDVEGTEKTALKVMSAAGGRPRELMKIPGLNFHALTFTPDGKYLLFGRRADSAGDEDIDWWRIPAEGGEPVRLDLKMKDLLALNFHPDGKQVTFTAGSPQDEIWVLENLLTGQRASR